MQTLDIAKDLVAMCSAGQFLDAINKHYADDIVSVEGASGPDMPARMEGIDAIRGKNEWWIANHEVHDNRIEGPFVAEDDDHFALIFHLDVTPKATGERMQMTEVAYYTVRDGKIAEERFYFPPMG